MFLYVIAQLNFDDVSGFRQQIIFGILKIEQVLQMNDW